MISNYQLTIALIRRAYDIVHYFDALQSGKHDESLEPAIKCSADDDPLHIAMTEYREGKLIIKEKE